MYFRSASPAFLTIQVAPYLCRLLRTDLSGQQITHSDADLWNLIAASWPYLRARSQWQLYNIAKRLGVWLPRPVSSVLLIEMATLQTQESGDTEVNNTQTCPYTALKAFLLDVKGLAGQASLCLVVQRLGQMKHGLHASNAHLDPMSQNDESSNAFSLPNASSSSLPPASIPTGDQPAVSGKIVVHMPLAHVVCIEPYHAEAT